MVAKAHPGLVNQGIAADVKNALKLAGFDLADVGLDRPVPPDGHNLLIEFWDNGMEIEDIMKELRLSEARVCAELLFLAIKGRIKRRSHNEANTIFYVDGTGDTGRQKNADEKDCQVFREQEPKLDGVHKRRLAAI